MGGREGAREGRSEGGKERGREGEREGRREGKIIPPNSNAGTFENVQAYSAQLVNIGVKDLCHEADLGRGHGVIVREEQLHGEPPSLIG